MPLGKKQCLAAVAQHPVGEGKGMRAWPAGAPWVRPQGQADKGKGSGAHATCRSATPPTAHSGLFVMAAHPLKTPHPSQKHGSANRRARHVHRAQTCRLAVTHPFAHLSLQWPERRRQNARNNALERQHGAAHSAAGIGCGAVCRRRGVVLLRPACRTQRAGHQLHAAVRIKRLYLRHPGFPAPVVRHGHYHAARHLRH